ncbi:MAG: flagellar export protein FliJ [Rhodoferax sp.]|nr:flagellar export protein FliJ [Rhodoferax sp.]
MSTGNPASKNGSGLARLVQLRQRELDQRQAELASRQAVRERYQRSVDQLEQLWRNSPASAASSGMAPALSLNSANYKQTVLQLASAHREDLVRHESTVDSARHAVVQASRTHGAAEQLLERQRQNLRREANLREQKSQDEIASLLWQRKPV